MRLLQNNKGSAILMAALLLASMMVVITGLQLQMYSARMVRQQLNFSARADNVARGGLQATLNWFRRQSSPVGPTFHPLGPTSTPPGTDTIDPTIGLVQEYALSGACRT